jgi:hypothetical protein
VKHSEFRARLSDYLERDLIPEERARVETHLAGCADCAGELRGLRATVSLLRRLPEPGHPPGLGDAVMRQIAQDASRPAPLRALVRRAAEPRFAAALAAGIAGFLLLVEAGDRGLDSGSGITPDPRSMEIASQGGAVLSAFENGLWPADEPRPRSAGAGVISGVSPDRTRSSGRYVPEYARRAHLQEVARLLRGAGHPHSASLASHLEAQPNVVMVDWQPR